MAGVNRISGSSDDASEVIRAAIAADASVFFRYERPDGTVTRHNAVYPKQLFDQGQHTFVRAYCHFTRDSRIFRVDRIRAVRIRRRLPDLPLRYEVAGAIGAIALLVAIFLFLLFFSPKYRWRQLRHQFFGSAKPPNAAGTLMVSAESSGSATEQPKKPFELTADISWAAGANLLFARRGSTALR